MTVFSPLFPFGGAGGGAFPPPTSVWCCLGGAAFSSLLCVVVCFSSHLYLNVFFTFTWERESVHCRPSRKTSVIESLSNSHLYNCGENGPVQPLWVRLTTTTNNNNPDKTSQNLSRGETIWKCSPLNCNHIANTKKHGTEETRHLTAASLPAPHPHVQRLEDSLAVPLEVASATLQQALWPPRKYFTSLLPRYSTPQVREWVAAAVSFTNHPKQPELWFTAASDLVCSLVALLHRSLWERVFSCASVAWRLSSVVLWHAFFKSAQASTCSAQHLLTSRKAPLVRPAGCILLGGGCHALACKRSWSFWALSSSSTASQASANSMSPSSVSCVTFFMVSSKISLCSAKVSRSCMVFWLRSQALVFASVFFLYVELRLPFRWFKRRCSSHNFFSVVSTSVAFTGASTLGASAASPPSSVPASPRFLSCPSAASPSVSVAESCDLPSFQWLYLPSCSAGFPRVRLLHPEYLLAYSWMVTTPHHTMTKTGHIPVKSGIFRQTWKESLYRTQKHDIQNGSWCLCVQSSKPMTEATVSQNKRARSVSQNRTCQINHCVQHVSCVCVVLAIAAGFVLTMFVDAGNEAPSQKEISHVLVRLLLRRDVKTIFKRHLTHACYEPHQLIDKFSASNSFPKKHAPPSVLPQRGRALG